MTDETLNRKSCTYQTAVTITGSCVWLTAAAYLSLYPQWQDQLAIISLVPVVILVCIFQLTFRLPSGTRFTNKLNFSLGDAVILLIACGYGIFPAIFVAGIEGYASSRRAVRRLSSNLFSASMMGLTAATASVTLSAVLRCGFGESNTAASYPFTAVAVAMLVASIVHITTNCILLFTLYALRRGDSIIRTCRESWVWMVPMLLPTNAAASLMYLALQHNVWMTFVVGAPTLIAIYLGHRQHRNVLQEQINIIERAQQERVRTIEKAHRETIEALAVTINAKDEVTHEHVQRVQIYATGVARLMGCSSEEIEALKAGALVHDIGKIGVPDTILHKPGKLTSDEFDQMKLHTVIGAKILGRVEFPYPVVPIVRSHHERWDGKGYPDGLIGDEIPMTARILSVVDCFDAVREDRPYRKGMTREQAIELLMQGSGTQYDPRVVGSFITHLPEFEAEIRAHRGAPLPVFAIEPTEELSEAARRVAPAAGLAEASDKSDDINLTRQQLGALFDLTQAVNSAHGEEGVLSAFTEKLGSIVPFDSCAVTLAAPDTGKYFVAHAAGFRAELLRGRTIIPGEGVTGWLLADGNPLYNTDPKLDLPSPLANQFASFRTLAAVPISDNGKLHGAITLYSSTMDEYAADHQRLLEEAARLLATALPRSRTTGESLLPLPEVTEPQLLLALDTTH